MHRSIRLPAVAILLLAGQAPAAAAERLAPADYARVNAALVANHVLPRYARLSAATSGFAARAEAYCADGGATKPAALRAALDETMRAWMAVQHLRFGPVGYLHRAQRFHFWPQARGKVANAVARALAGGRAALEAARFARSNAAVQGLLGAEALVHDGRYAGADRKGCPLLRAVAGNMQRMAAGIAAEWRGGDAPFARTVTGPGPHNDNFANHREATLAFFRSLHDGLQFIADVRLTPVLGAAPDKARPHYAESRLSRRSMQNIVESLEALRALYQGDGGPGLGDLARIADPKLDRLMRRAFRITAGTARSIGRPLEEAVEDPALRPKVRKLALQVRALRQIVRDRLAAALGLLAAPIAAGFVGGLAAPLLPRPLRAAAPGPVFLSARAHAGGGYAVSGFAASGAPAFDLPLPGRGHSFAVRPDNRMAVHFSRRPGNFALAVDLARRAVQTAFAAPPDRHLYGHGVFGPDGRLLYATENNFAAGRGAVGIYDAENVFARIGEIPYHGIGPHEIRLLSDGTTLAVANGGIATRPDLPRIKLNLPTMDPSLCYIDRRSGALLGKVRLPEPLRRLGIRHIAVGPDDRVAVAMQDEGPGRRLAPLVAIHRPQPGGRVPRREEPLQLLGAPAAILRAMKRYCGSVCFDSGGAVIAASAPRGNLVTFWESETGAFLSAATVGDGCGIAPAGSPGRFLASSGRGGVFAVDARSGAARPVDAPFLNGARWDNHLVAAAA